jgi:tRNA threonylcarbamoyladenosine biosynthesis protein TsaB
VSVLAIDTSSRWRAVSVLTHRDGRLVGSRVGDGGRLDTGLAQQLEDLAESDLEALVVVTGPGSYTGVRAGMAAALGIAHARRLPLHGIGALEVVGAGSPGTTWVAVGAGRGAVYAARCRLEAGAMRCRPAVRLTLDSLAAAVGAEALGSPDKLAVEGLRLVDPVSALAAAVPVALARPPLSFAGLSAIRVD